MFAENYTTGDLSSNALPVFLCELLLVGNMAAIDSFVYITDPPPLAPVIDLYRMDSVCSLLLQSSEHLKCHILDDCHVI